MKTDNFWKIFWLVNGVFLVIGIFIICWLKFSYINRPDNISRALAVGVTFDPSKDPFESRVREKILVSLVSGYLYQDSLPLGFEDWSWNSKVNWRTSENVYEGSYATKVNFLEPWAGIRLSSHSIDISEYKSLEIAVRPDQNIKDLYIEIQDKYGNSIGRQSIGWYTASSTLTSNSWNYVTIPIENFFLSSNTNREVTGFSINSEQVGLVFVDSIKLNKTVSTHSKWEGPVPSFTWVGSDPFTGVVQRSIPYSLIVDSKELESWQKLFGQFEKVNNVINIGPIPKKTNGSIAVFGGGKDWTDYRADVVVYWGMTSTFSLLARFENDSNFVSCAYSNYGAVVQIYIVKDGTSKLIGQTPGLAITAYEPWKNAKHGIEVNGNKISCFADNEKVLTATLADMSLSGTVGFETWSFSSEDYPHKIVSLEVKPI